MARTVSIHRQDIIDAAIELVRENGHEALNARALAERIGCSTQPIFSNFKSMDEVMDSVLETALELYNGCVSDSISSGKHEPVYKAHGRAYIRFAMEQPKLFKLLFMRDRTNDTNPVEQSTFMAVLPLIMKATGLDREQAALFHFEIWAAVHGIAVMAASSYYNADMDLISGTLTDVYQGLLYRFGQRKTEATDEQRH